MSLDPFLAMLAEDEFRVVKTAIHPDRWESFSKKYKLQWTYTKFQKNCYKKVGKVAGLYCFHIGHQLPNLPYMGISLYGGETCRELRIRCREYEREMNDPKGRVTIKKLLKVFEGELNFAWAPIVVTKAQSRKLEKDFNDAMMPPYSLKDFSASVKAGKSAWQ